MVAIRVPDEFPPFIVRPTRKVTGEAAESLREFYLIIRDFIRNMEEWRIRLILSINDHADRFNPETGTVAPTSTPADVQLFYLDTVAKDMYVSVGTSSSADWKKITP